MSAVKEEDSGQQHIKEENLRDGYGREIRGEVDGEHDRGVKESSEKRRGRETEREEHSSGDSSKEVRQPGYLQYFICSVIPLVDMRRHTKIKEFYMRSTMRIVFHQ